MSEPAAFTDATFRGPRHFARWMLARPIADWIQPHRMRAKPIFEIVVFASGPWQVSLLVIPPGDVVRRHRHPRSSSAELWLGGGGAGWIGGRLLSVVRHGCLAANLVMVPRGVWHEGEVGPDGLAYLSFQHWLGEPGFVADDWEE